MLFWLRVAVNSSYSAQTCLVLKCYWPLSISHLSSPFFFNTGFPAQRQGTRWMTPRMWCQTIAGYKHTTCQRAKTARNTNYPTLQVFRLWGRPQSPSKLTRGESQTSKTLGQDLKTRAKASSPPKGSINHLWMNWSIFQFIWFVFPHVLLTLHCIVYKDSKSLSVTNVQKYWKWHWI